MGFPRQEYRSGLPLNSLGVLPDTGMELMSPALAGRFFITEPSGKPQATSQFSPVQSLSHVQLFATPGTAAGWASPSITNSWSPPKPKSIEFVMLSIYLILCCPLILCPQSFPASGSFKWVSSSHQIAKVLEFHLQHQSFQWAPRTGLL